jgi:hypothetical protein
VGVVEDKLHWEETFHGGYQISFSLALPTRASVEQWFVPPARNALYSQCVDSVDASEWQTEISTY